jgi:hypothetical protein
MMRMGGGPMKMGRAKAPPVFKMTGAKAKLVNPE